MDMIGVRSFAGQPAQWLSLDDFEREVRQGKIGPNDHICVPVVTGKAFVRAGELEFFQSLYPAANITFRRHFNLSRVPWLTTALVAALVAIYAARQEPPPTSPDALLRQGGKHWDLMVELGEWWRLWAANALHFSGWHLFINAFFLFNLGGVVEAVFRRVDYILIVVLAGAGSMVLSTAAMPSTTSVGASGIVFGLWGALCVFGLRHRKILPSRYRRYFLGSVVPYSIIALYLGFAFPGIDNWSHAGGLLAGTAAAFFSPARLLAPRRTSAVPKLLAAATLIAIPLSLPRLPVLSESAFTTHRYYPHDGLVVPVPHRWRLLHKEHVQSHRMYAYGNGAGVAVGFDTRLAAHPLSPNEAAEQFVEQDLAVAVQSGDVIGLRIEDPQPISLSNLSGSLLRVRIKRKTHTSTVQYVIMTRGHFRYIVSMSSPDWLFDSYEPVFRAIRDNIYYTEPDIVLEARRAFQQTSTPETQCTLATALWYAANHREAKHLIRQGLENCPLASNVASHLNASDLD